MPEQFKGERGPAPEKIEDQKYQELLESRAKIDDLIGGVHDLEARVGQPGFKEPEKRKLLTERNRQAALLDKNIAELRKLSEAWLSEIGAQKFKSEDIDYMRDSLSGKIEHSGGEFSETLEVKPNQKIEQTTTVEGRVSFFTLISAGLGPKDVEGLYRHFADLQETFPEYTFEVEVDPESKRWVKYTVRRKEEKKL